MVPYLRAANVKDGYLDLTDTKEMNFTPDEQQVFSLRQGDVLVSEGAGSLAAVGASAVWDGSVEGVICFQNTLLRLRPRPSVASSSFLAWWARHAYASGLFASVAIGVNIYHLSADRVRSLPVRFPRIAAQEQVADYLDRETARMDELIERKRALVGLLHDALTARITARINEVARISATLPLRRVAAVSFSNVDKKIDEGNRPVRLCNYTDVYDQDEITDDPGFMAATATSDQIKGFGLHADDVLVTKDSETPDDIGVPAWVPEDLPGVVCGYHLAIIRPDRSRLRGDYLFWALKSPMCQEQFSVAANGITRFGLRVDAVQGILVPVPSLDEQAAIAAELKAAASSAHRAADAITRQVNLLRDHRQALITAAVTGQIEVSGEAA
jgi:type I restriction enzyme S subunit